MTPTPRTTPALRLGLVALLAVPLLTACGLVPGGDSDDDPAEGGFGAGTGQSPGPLPEDQAFPLDNTFWYAGFQVDLTGAVVSAAENAFGEVARLLSLDATFTNLGPDQGHFGSQVAVVAGGNTYLPWWEQEVPSVPAGLSSTGALVFEIDEAFDIGSAALVVGGDDVNQAQVPLGPQGGELVALEPSEPALDAQISLDLVDITVTGADLRADVPVNYQQVPAGTRALTLHFTVTSRKGGSWSLHPTDFALILPGGNAAGADGSQLGSFSGNESGIDTPDRYLRFLVDDPPAGEYTLRLSLPSYWQEPGGDTEGTATFTLP